MSCTAHIARLSTLILALATLTGCLTDEAPADDLSMGADSSENRPPTIAGSPPLAVKSGDAFQFEPDASDPDGDPLAFSVENKPVWASFDSKSGRLSGRPTLGNVGTYSNIVVSVSDGISSSSLNPFTVTVTQVALASTTLSWTPPTENSNGSPLLDLAGYRIYYGQTAGHYTNFIDIDNAGVTTAVVDNLIPGTYYFVATARNSLGVESEFSNVAEKIAE